MGWRVFLWSSLWGMTSALRALSLELDSRVRANLARAKDRENDRG